MERAAGKKHSEQQFQSEFECDFIGSTNTLISSSKLHCLNYITPIHNNNDGLAVYEEPKEDHVYVMVVDTARGQGLDYSAFAVIDITESPYKLVARFRNNTIAPLYIQPQSRVLVIDTITLSF